jgi:membrane-associated phospholipid phosphatase
MKRKDLLYIIIPPVIQSGLYFVSKLLIGTPHLIGSTLDKKTPFISQFVFFYVLWYILLVLAPYLLFKYDKEKRDKYCFIYIMSGILAFIFFLIYPTTIERANFHVHNFSTWIVSLVYFFDTPALNCLPSIHCTNCFIWILFIGLNKKVPKWIRISLSLFCICVVFSILFVKQHVIIDIIGAAILVALCYLIYFGYKKIVKK